MNTLVVALISIAISVLAQFSLRAGMAGDHVRGLLAQSLSLKTVIGIATDAYVIGGFALYGLGAVVWLAVLSRWNVSKAYPLVGLGFVFSAAIGFVVGEQVTPIRLAGVALIAAGVLVIAQS